MAEKRILLSSTGLPDRKKYWRKLAPLGEVAPMLKKDYVLFGEVAKKMLLRLFRVVLGS